MLAELWQGWLQSTFLTWGLGPMVIPGVAYVITACLLEWLLSIRRAPVRGWVDAHLVEYRYGKIRSRREAIDATRAKIDLRTQIVTALKILFGPAAIVGGLAGSLIFSYSVRDRNYLEQDGELPTLTAFVWQMVIMELVGDFALYWGHRIQHQNAWLWKNCHSVHHQLETPTPFGTVFIDGIDATLQASLPIFFAVLVAQPHPLSAYLYIYARIAENVINHSGLESTLLDVLCLKILPGRASVAHHDSHHKYSNFGPKSKNFGENFWLWDWAFGTLRPTGASFRNAAEPTTTTTE